MHILEHSAAAALILKVDTVAGVLRELQEVIKNKIKNMRNGISQKKDLAEARSQLELYEAMEIETLSMTMGKMFLEKGEKEEK